MAPNVDQRAVADRLVLGTWRIFRTHAASDSSIARLPEGQQQLQRLLSAAWQAGITTADTSLAYGGKAGYERLAAYFQTTGHKFSLTAKVGRRFVCGRFESCLEVGELIAEVKLVESIVGDVDVILIKDPPVQAVISRRFEEILESIGRVFRGRAIGVSTHIPEIVDCLSRFRRTGVVMAEYNMINQQLMGDVLRNAKQAGWHVWSMQPLAYGFLGGRVSRNTVFEKDDFRSQMSMFCRQTLVAFAESFAALIESSLPNVSLAAASIAYCLLNPDIDRVVVGPTNVQQLSSALNALEVVDLQSFRCFAARMRDQDRCQ